MTNPGSQALPGNQVPARLCLARQSLAGRAFPGRAWERETRVMLSALINWSLRNRFLVLVAVLGFVAAGWISLQQLNIDAFPDTTPVQVQINTVAPGLGPLEVEKQITFPVEQTISGLPGLQQVRSLSKFGLSQVVVTFQDGTDIYFARQLLTERLSTAQSLSNQGAISIPPQTHCFPSMRMETPISHASSFRLTTLSY